MRVVEPDAEKFLVVPEKFYDVARFRGTID
jgi:hypothetical protein